MQPRMIEHAYTLSLLHTHSNIYTYRSTVVKWNWCDFYMHVYACMVLHIERHERKRKRAPYYSSCKFISHNKHVWPQYVCMCVPCMHTYSKHSRVHYHPGHSAMLAHASWNSQYMSKHCIWKDPTNWFRHNYVHTYKDTCSPWTPCACTCKRRDIITDTYIHTHTWTISPHNIQIIICTHVLWSIKARVIAQILRMWGGSVMCSSYCSHHKCAYHLLHPGGNLIHIFICGLCSKRHGLSCAVVPWAECWLIDPRFGLIWSGSLCQFAIF